MYMQNEINEENRDLVDAFLGNLVKLKSLNKTLLISHSFFNSFGSLKSLEYEKITGREMKFPDEGKWDLILGDFAIGAKPLSEELAKLHAVKHNYASIVKSMDYVGENGYGIFLLEESSIKSKSNNLNIIQVLQDKGCFVDAILGNPKNYLAPHTAMKSLFVVVSKNKKDTQFVAALRSSVEAIVIAENFTSFKDTKDLYSGLIVRPGTFKGFDEWNIDLQINSLDTAYSKFEKKKISEIALKINLCKTGESFNEEKNSTYFPLIGTQPVVAEINETKIKHQNYVQIVCNPEIINASYLAAFLNSALGNLIRDSLSAKASFIPRLTKADITEISVGIPDLKIQKDIIDSIKKLKTIREKISLFEDNFSINPINPSVNRKIDLILEAVDELDDADKIKSIIREGESKTIEFKQTFNLDVKSQKESANNFLVTASIKTIAAFLNTDGGTLLIGVADNGEVTGIDEEIERLNGNIPDKFLLHFKNFIHHRIGAEFYPYIDQKIVEVDEKKVLFVTCKQSEKEVFVDGKDFYVRSNPSTDKLEGSKLLDYIKNHFKLKGS
jgi:hypothetical protein